MFDLRPVMITLSLGVALIGQVFNRTGTDKVLATPTPALPTRLLRPVVLEPWRPVPVHTPALPPTPTARGLTPATAPPPRAPTSTITVARPIRLIIPTLAIDAMVESVGQDASGAMEIPSRVEQVAWYALGSAPGEIGNAVIAGHLDLADGSPAVFWDIDQLPVGAEVIVYDAAQSAYHFRVTGKQRYPYDAAPLEQIFGFALHSQLNLITCAGAWDNTRHNYSDRLVVYTTLVKTVLLK